MNKKRRQKATSPPFNLVQHECKLYFLPTLGLCGLLMGILLFDANLSLTGDNAQFINLGRSLAEGYGLSETIEGDPIPHTKYPFGFPLLLAIVHILFPDSLIALKSLVVLLYAISIPLTYLLIRRFAPPPMALGVSALCLASPLLLDYSHQVMSEIPFLLCSLLALLLLHRAQESSTLSTLALAIIAIIAAYYIRSAGIILIGTGIIFFALHKKWKEAGLIAIGSILLALPYQIRNASLGGNDYINQLLSINPYRPEEGTLTFTTLIERIIANLELYGLQIIPHIFLPSFTDTNYFVGLFFSCLILYALIAGIVKRNLLIVYLTCYLILYILWPDMWSDTRFLVPVIPILFYAILTSLDELLHLLARALKKTASRTGVALFFLFLLGSNIYETNTLASYTGQLPSEWANYFAAAEWIKNNTEPDVKIACRKPYLMNAISSRKATGYAWKAPDEVIADFEEKNIEIVVIDQLGFRSTPEFLAPAIQAHVKRFKILHIVPNPKTYVLTFK
ncbi:MAG: glycosyltransferase family 39 protein [Gemmatimonadota bacterium]|nr:glycosyltransferase family 39 protein [Gemmatimonadota bacterium]MDE2954488.1 glycosyltransferase family 39 protein [Gemmatimonadota bacterium]